MRQVIPEEGVQTVAMDKTTGMMRRTVMYSGRVQGVGFRATAVECAKPFSVYGYVRNLTDGRVELVVEGAADEIDRFLAAIADVMGRLIARVDVANSAATGEFKRFTIQV